MEGHPLGFRQTWWVFFSCGFLFLGYTWESLSHLTLFTRGLEQRSRSLRRLRCNLTQGTFLVVFTGFIRFGKGVLSGARSLDNGPFFGIIHFFDH